MLLLSVPSPPCPSSPFSCSFQILPFSASLKLVPRNLSMNSTEPISDKVNSTDDQSNNDNGNSSNAYFDIYGPQVITLLCRFRFSDLFDMGL